jgi:DNA-binding MarR family transcriptional regulator
MDQTVDFQTISDFDSPEQSPGFLLWQVSSSWRRQIEQVLKNFDLTHPQFVVLANLAWLGRSNEQITQKELAQQVFIDTATLSQIIRGLEKKTLIKRVRIEGDERAKYPVITETGASLITQALPIVEACDKEFFSKLKHPQDFTNHLKLLNTRDQF